MTEKTPRCFGGWWDEDSVECSGGADPLFIGPGDSNQRRRCSWFNACKQETLASDTDASKLIPAHALNRTPQPPQVQMTQQAPPPLPVPPVAMQPQINAWLNQLKTQGQPVPPPTGISPPRPSFVPPQQRPAIPPVQVSGTGNLFNNALRSQGSVSTGSWAGQPGLGSVRTPGVQMGTQQASQPAIQNQGVGGYPVQNNWQQQAPVQAPQYQTSYPQQYTQYPAHYMQQAAQSVQMGQVPMVPPFMAGMPAYVPMNHMMPGAQAPAFLAVPEPDGASFLSRFLMTLGRGLAKAAGLTVANFFDHNTGRPWYPPQPPGAPGGPQGPGSGSGGQGGG